MTKAQNQEALTEALAALMTQLASSNELHRQLMEENRALRDAASAAEPPRATAGGTRASNHVRLMADLSRRIQKYSYTIGEPDSFRRWLTRHEPIFEEDGSELSEREKTRLLLGSLEETTFHRFVDSQRHVEDIYDVTFKETVVALTKIFGAQRSLMVQRQACFHISRSSGNWEDPLEYTNHIGQLVADAKLATMTADEWSVFLFFRGLDAPGDAAAKIYLMQFTEMTERKGETITLSQIHDEWMRFLQIKQQTKIVATSKQNPQTPVEVWKLEASKTKRRENPRFTPKWGSKDRRPAFCAYCKRAGHHISKCFLKRKDEGTETQSIKVDVVNAELSAKRSVRVNVNGKPLQFDLDTGSMITLINSKSWKFIGRPPLERVEHRISCANGSEMRVLGRARVTFALKGSEYKGYVYVRERNTNLIGMSWLSQSPLMRNAMDVMVNQIEIPSAGMARLKDNPTVRSGNCQQNTKRTRITPSKPCPDTKKPWAHIYVDFAGPINGFWFLVVEDSKTKYAEVKLTRKASAAATVDLIEEIFATHGYPDWIVSDNETQLSSHLFKKMCESHGITHKTTATYCPRSNGAAERFADILKRGIAKIKGSASINQRVLNNFLINYRNTPHAALNGATPAECHFSRKIRTTRSSPILAERASENTEWIHYQNKMKGAYGKRNGARANTFEVDQKVYARVQHGNKWSWGYGKVRKRVGSVLYEVQIGEKMQRCHANQLRQRHGDKGPEELFSDSNFPLFSDSMPAQKTNSPKLIQNQRVSEGLRGETNLLRFPDFSSFSCNHPELDVVNSGRSPRVVRQGVFGSSPAAHDTSRSDGFGRVNRGNQKMECRSELNKNQSPNSRTFLERKEEVSSPCKQQLESEEQQDVSRVQPAPNLSQSLRRSQHNRRAPFRYDPCSELQSHSEDRAPKRGSAPYSDRAAARSRGLHIASNCRLAPSQGRTKDNFVKGEGVGKARGRPRWY
uniref:Integrase catalytic domain-containing protein n=1 Tax=Caenorhabditis japonica TaxID=281687 RepID=A0A8R1IA25_CAEJA